MPSRRRCEKLRCQPGPGRQRFALEDFRIDGGEGIAGGEDALQPLARGIEQGDAHGVATGAGADGLHAVGNQRRGIGAVEILKIDGDLGQRDIEPAGSPGGSQELLETCQR